MHSARESGKKRERGNNARKRKKIINKPIFLLLHPYSINSYSMICDKHPDSQDYEFEYIGHINEINAY